MTNDASIDLIGDEELLKILHELDVKSQHRILKRVVSDSANIYVKAVKRGIPTRETKLQPSGKRWHPSGTGKRSIMKKMGRSRRTATVFVGPRTGTGNPHTDAWYLKFWEYGTKKMAPNLRITAAYHANKSKVEDNMYNSIRKIFSRVIAKNAKR